MKIDTLVRNTATVSTVVKLEPGDVYKRLHKDYTGEKLVFGIVESVMANDEDSAVVAIEFDPGYGCGVTPSIATFSTDGTIILFAATANEVKLHFDKVLASAQSGVTIAQQMLNEKMTTLAMVQRVVDQQLDALRDSQTITA